MNIDETQKLIALVDSLKVQLWVVSGGGGILLMVFMWMAKTMWDDNKTTLANTVQRVNDHDIIFAKILDRHDISEAIVQSGDKIVESINQNANKAMNTLAAITPPGPSNRR